MTYEDHRRENCLTEVRALIKEYTDALGRDLSFQHLDEELQDPAHKYTAPNGELLVAVENGALLGMVAYHRHSDTRCEMKRLYVRPEARGDASGQRPDHGNTCPREGSRP